jgi:iron-sulfur cluster insertion protein
MGQPAGRQRRLICRGFGTILGGMESSMNISSNAESAPPGIVFTDAAARKVQELILEERNPDLKLRVYISGGGCSGFQYGFSFDEVRAEDDIAVENDGVTLLVDPLSFQYLMGAEVDYSESLQGAQFIIRNPNAATTCGCGSSFSV